MPRRNRRKHENYDLEFNKFKRKEKYHKKRCKKHGRKSKS